MMRLTSVLLVVFFGAFGSQTLAASEVTKPAGASGVASLQLPFCVDDPDALKAIAEKQKANSKTAFKYDGYREALNASSEDVLAARLVYAETLATNCANRNAEIAPLIAEVVMNRVAIRKGDVKAVVFQRDQFASSMNMYEESRYRDFLCPKDGALWNHALRSVRKYQSDKTHALPATALNYYLYKHSARFPEPNWNLKEVTPKGTSKDLGACIRFFDVPKWR